MAIPPRTKAAMKKAGLSETNDPKKTPKHKTKSHVVMAAKKGRYKLIRFGEQGVTGAGKNPKTKKQKMRRKLYYGRHDAQDPKPDIFSARYWSHRTKW